MKTNKKKLGKMKYPFLINNDDELDKFLRKIVHEELEERAKRNEREMTKTFKKNKKAGKSGKVILEETDF